MLMTLFLSFLFLLFILAPAVTIVGAIVIGFIQGVQGGNDNGFDDFVNSNRISDGK